MSQLADTYPLIDFREQAEEHLERLRRNGQPELLTVDGKPELVIQAVEPYQRLLELSDRTEAIAGARRGLASKAEGRGVPAAEAFETIRARHGIRRDA